MYVDPDPECDEEDWGAARATAAPVAVAVALFGVYAATYGVERFFTYPALLGAYGVALQFVLLGGLLVAHEAIHAVTYRLVGVSWADVAVEADLFPGDSLDPVHVSVHPDRPVRRSAYAVGVAMPGVLLGLVPAAVGLATGNPLATFVGLFGVVMVSTDVNALVDLWRRPEAVAAPEAASSR